MTDAGVPPLRVFFSIDASERAHRGGPSVRAQQTAAALAALGHEVELGERAEPGRFDVVHVFNSWPAVPSLARLEAARASGGAVVFSPIYMDHRETDWARRVLRHGFAGARLGIGSLGALGRLRRAPPEARVARSNRAIREYRALVPRMVALADHVIVLSEAERAGLAELGCAPRAWSRVWNAVDPAPFARATGERFRAEYGVADYVLCVGRIELRKNQALLIHALRRSGRPLVLVGRCLDPDHARVIDQRRGAGRLARGPPRAGRGAARLRVRGRGGVRAAELGRGRADLRARSRRGGLSARARRSRGGARVLRRAGGLLRAVRPRLDPRGDRGRDRG